MKMKIKKPKNITKNLLLAFLVFLLISALFSFFSIQTEKPETVALSQVAQEVNEEKVKEIVVEGNDLTVVLREGDKQQKARKENEASLTESLKNYGVEPEKLRKVNISVKEPSGALFWLETILPFLLPFILIGILVWFMFRQAQRGSMQAFSFIKTKAKMAGPGEKVTFADVAGLKEAKQELQEVVDFLRHPKKYLDIGAKIPRGVLLMGPPGTGKCITGNSLVTTNKGLIPIQEIPKYFTVDENDRVIGAEVLSFNIQNNNFEWQSPSHWFDLGESRTLRMITQLGTLIEGTPEHPLVVLNNQNGGLEFKKIEDIKKGERILVSYNHHAFGSYKKITSADVAYLLGLLTGDGGLTIKDRVSFSSADDELVVAFCRIIKSLWQYKPVLKGKYDYIIYDQKIKKALLEYGLGEVYSTNKKIPESILMAPKEIAAVFLQGLFDTDGYCGKQEVELSSASEDLITAVHYLLLNFGIINRIYSRKKIHNNKLQFYVSITGDFLQAFSDQIGFKLTRKQKVLSALLQKTRNTNLNLIYSQSAVFSSLWQATQAAGFSANREFYRQPLYKNLHRYINGARNPSVSAVSQVLDFFERSTPTIVSHRDFQYLSSLNQGKFFFSSVVDIKESYARVYDFTVPKNHSFVANNLVNHNTLLARATSGEAGVPFFHISGSEFVEMFVGVGASIKGDELVLVRQNGKVRLAPIKEIVDSYYQENQSDIVVSVSNLETLGIAKKETSFRGFKNNKDKFLFGGSKWTQVKGVYRHKAKEIYEIHYRGGKVETTGDHSLFVREKNYVRAKRADELKPGEALANLPFKTRGIFLSGVGTTHNIRGHQFENYQPLKLAVWQENAELLEKYQLIMTNRNLVPQYELAKTTGVSQTTVGEWQRGAAYPRALSLKVFKSRINVPKEVNVTPNLMRLFGYYTAEGRKTDYFIQFVFGSHEKELHRDCISLIRDVFCLEPHLEFTNDNTLRITYHSKEVGEFFEKHCGTGSHHKRLPEFAWELPYEYVQEYVKGYSLGDGYHTTDGKLSITSVSERLIRELSWLLAMHGIQAGVRTMKASAGRVIKNKPLPGTISWNLIIGKTSNIWNKKLIKSPNQFKRTIITKIIKKEYDGYVYDFCGCDNEAFFAGRKPILVHNSRVRDTFATAKKNAPSILFIDELDAIGRHRGAGLGGGHDEREQTLNQILVEMDGFERDTNVIVMAASVTGDTPVLVKKDNEVKLRPIAEVIDNYYSNDEDNVEKSAFGLEVLGFESKHRGRGNYFKKAVFKKVRGVFRHKVIEIYEIEFVGGKVRTTGNHSVFVRAKWGVQPKLVAELKEGEILVDLPYKVNRTNKKLRDVRGAEFNSNFALTLSVWQPLFGRQEMEFVNTAHRYALANTGVISQSKIGSMFGFSQTTIGKWQKGFYGPRILSRNYYQDQGLLPETVQVTPELMRLFGYYLAEGYSRKELDFCFNRKEVEYIEDVKYLMRKIFNLDLSRERQITSNAVNIIYYSKPVAEFFAYHLGKGAHNKHLPHFLFEAPKEYFVEFLRGYAAGDGYLDKRGRLEITSVSKRLIQELNWLSRMHGFKSYVHSFVAKDGRRIGGGKPLSETIAWRIGFGKTQNPLGPRVGKASTVRAIVKHVRKLPFSGYVYDFCGCENEAFFGGEIPILLHNTNRPDILDPALLRPGRFDRRVILDEPDINDREQILKIHAKGKPLAKDVHLRRVAERTPGFSGADLANIMNEAAILAARHDRTIISQEDILESIEKVMLGPERKSHILSAQEKEITAYHEAGHALVTAILPGTDPVHKVSIVARGRAGGYTLKLPAEDRHLHTRSQFINDLSVMLGGYAAEKIVFKELTTGASNDLQKATELSRRLVTQFGMSERLGPMTFGHKEELVFLGKEIHESRNYSETVAFEIDKEVRKMIFDAYRTAQRVIRENKHKLDKIAKVLIEKETLEKEEFEALMRE